MACRSSIFSHPSLKVTDLTGEFNQSNSVLFIDSKVSILATSPAAQKFLQTFSQLSQGPLNSAYISSSAPTHPYDVIKRQHTSPLRVPNQPMRLPPAGHESLTQAMQGMSVGEQLIGHSPIPTSLGQVTNQNPAPASLGQLAGQADQGEGEETSQSDSLAMGAIPDRHMESSKR